MLASSRSGGSSVSGSGSAAAGRGRRADGSASAGEDPYLGGRTASRLVEEWLSWQTRNRTSSVLAAHAPTEV
jgi:hypothetical protein